MEAFANAVSSKRIFKCEQAFKSQEDSDEDGDDAQEDNAAETSPERKKLGGSRPTNRACEESV